MSASPADVYPKRNFGEDCLIKKIDTGLQAQKMLQIEIVFTIFCLQNRIPIQLRVFRLLYVFLWHVCCSVSSSIADSQGPILPNPVLSLADHHGQPPGSLSGKKGP